MIVKRIFMFYSVDNYNINHDIDYNTNYNINSNINNDNNDIDYDINNSNDKLFSYFIILIIYSL